jgi:disulfide bond formation protein DsbB
MLESLPFSEMLSTVLSGSGECALIDWSFLGLAMPAWVLISVVVLWVFGVWNNCRRPVWPVRG